MTLERGTLLHKRYRIVEILGQGGMGSVYRAVDENLGVDVALKENLFTTDEYARQFRLEAVILANLRHPNLPRVSDHFVVGDQGQYLVMDYIEGEDLRQRMERLGTISEDEAVTIGAAMCDALTYLHTRKPPILHRDLKPGNVKITPDGHIFLVDFGLAKVVQGSQATTTGARAMTPGYSPPEQYGTARTDPRTDIYSLGATLYAALTGIIPEDGLARAMDNAQLTPLRKRMPKISRRLASVIEKAMSVDPAERYQTADDFKNALLSAKSKSQHLPGEFLVAPPPPAGEEGKSPERPKSTPPAASKPPSNGFLVEESDHPFTPPKKKRKGSGCLTMILLLLLVVAAAVVSWFYVPGFPDQVNTWLNAFNSMVVPSLGPTPTPLPTQTPMDVATATATLTPTLAATATLTPTATLVPTATFTPSPTPQGGGYGQFAFVSDRSGKPQIYLASVSGGDERILTNMDNGACQPVWSPDGTQLLFTSPCPRYDENGQSASIFKNSSLYVLDMTVDGATPMPLSSEPGGEFDPAWSPDGNRIAFSSFRDGRPLIYVYDLAKKTTQRLIDPTSDFDEARHPVWSPLGNLLLFVVKRVEVYQTWVMTDTGADQQQVVHSGQDVWDYHPAWSPDGLSILFSERRVNTPSKAWLMMIRYEDRDNLPATKLNFGPTPIENIGFSPDGFWIIFEGQDESENRDIYIMTVDGGNRTRVTTDSARDFDPAWRPLR